MSSYKRLTSLMLGSQFVNFQSQSYSLQDKIRRDGIRIVGETSQSNSLGERSPLLPQSEFPGREVQFSELRGKPLGHVSSILFNTTQQKTLLDSLDKREPTVILGNYGTGKSVVFQTAARKFNSAEDLNVHFISAIGKDLITIHKLRLCYLIFLDYECQAQYYKISDDILDLQLRAALRDTGVTVTSVGKLRRESMKLSGI